MKSAADRCPEDLLARSRRGPLSPVERRALDAHLGVCGLCRAAVALGGLADDVPDLPSEDDAAVVARLAVRVVARMPRRPGRARQVALAAGLALMVTAGAAAAWIAARRVPALPSHAEAVVRVPALPEIAPIAPRVEVVPAPRAIAEGRRRHAPAVDRTAATALAAQPEGPDRLFADANAARGAGDLRAAASRYDLLERQYPQSPEATVSLVSAGDLLARLGEPAAALERFDRYLTANARGPLAPEALFGRARCLRALGQPEAELRAWQDLLSRFPGSMYDGAARRGVNELSR